MGLLKIQRTVTFTSHYRISRIEYLLSDEQSAKTVKMEFNQVLPIGGDGDGDCRR
jgi:hypothetical protein